MIPQREVLLQQRLEMLLDSNRLGKPCYAFKEVASAMDIAHQLASEAAPEGTCVWAQRQTQGRGRAGRKWVSPEGGMYMSLILRPLRKGSELPQLSLVAGLSAAKAIEELSGISASIRWPNDVLIKREKVAGILTEAKSTSASQLHVAVGIGINVTTSQSELPDGACSISKWADPAPERFILAARFLAHFEDAYSKWTDGGFCTVRLDMLKHFDLFGQLVRIQTDYDEFEGQILDLDENGSLLVRLDSGVIRPFEMGEVSLLR